MYIIIYYRQQEIISVCVLNRYKNILKLFMGRPKKPPDSQIDRYKKYLTSYKCVKTSLKSIVRSKKTIQGLEKIVTSMNRIVIHTYQFLKLYCLHRYHKYDRLPDIDRQLIVLIMKTVQFQKLISMNYYSIHGCDDLLEFLNGLLTSNDRFE